MQVSPYKSSHRFTYENNVSKIILFILLGTSLVKSYNLKYKCISHEAHSSKDTIYFRKTDLTVTEKIEQGGAF